MTDCKVNREVYNSIILLLSRREHSVYELEQKLAKYGVADVRDAIAYCISLDLQSDLRFAQMLCRTRIRQGHGPRRIEQDLQKARVHKDLIAEVLLSENENWREYLLQIWEKKYRNNLGKTPAEKRKQQQFLLSRGFYPADIMNLFRSNVNYDLA